MFANESIAASWKRLLKVLEFRERSLFERNDDIGRGASTDHDTSSINIAQKEQQLGLSHPMEKVIQTGRTLRTFERRRRQDRGLGGARKDT